MKDFTIEIKVKAPKSGCAYDWAIRTIMSEAKYCQIESVTVFDKDGRDVTEDEEIYFGYDKDWFEKQVENAEEEE